MDDINIALCDDENHILEELNKIIKQYVLTMVYDVNIKINVFDNGSSLLEQIENVDVLFLDVEMPEMDGFMVAKKIRSLDMKVKIIFLTSHKEYIQEAFKVLAYRYLYKPITEVMIVEVMDEIMQEIKDHEVISIKNAQIETFIKVQNIYYIEALGDGVAIHTDNRTFVEYHSLRFWLERLQGRFYRCHRSYLVAYAYISELQDSRAILENGISIPISVRNRSDFKKNYIDYILKKSRII